MNTNSSPSGRTSVRGRRSFGPALALTVIALGAMTTGCIQSHDPRNDSSRLTTPERSVIAFSTSHSRS
jgi:hypothetical protein